MVRVRTWSGPRAGEGASTDVDTPLRVAAGSYRPKIKALSGKDVIASSGLYSAGDYRLGPLTMAYAGGGYSPTTIDPVIGGSPTEILFRISGGIFGAGAWFQRVADETDSALHIFVVLRKTAIMP